MYNCISFSIEYIFDYVQEVQKKIKHVFFETKEDIARASCDDMDDVRKEEYTVYLVHENGKCMELVYCPSRPNSVQVVVKTFGGRSIIFSGRTDGKGWINLQRTVTVFNAEEGKETDRRFKMWRESMRD